MNKTPKKTVSITLPAEQVEAAQALAKKLRMPLSSLYRWPISAFHEYVERNEGRVPLPLHIEQGEGDPLPENTIRFPL